MFAIPSFFGYNTTFVSTPVATAATGVGETSFTANWNAFAGASYYLLDVSTSSSFSSFVLQDQVVYTNSYAVTGLTSNTTYYYRLRASTTYDTDAEAFFTRVSSNGGSLTTTEQQAVNSLVIQMKADGIWTAMKAIYPMVGGGTGSTAAREAACAQNLKSSSFTGTFSSGWTFASTGVTPNGTSAFMQTNFIPSVEFVSASSNHISFYSRTNQSVATNCEMGAFDTSIGTPIVMLAIKSDSSGGHRYELRNFCLNGNFGPTPPSDTRGFACNTKISSGAVKGFWNNSLIGSETVVDALTNREIYIGGRNSNGTANTFSSKQCAFASVGDGLTDTQASNFYSAVQAFQTTLSRNV